MAEKKSIFLLATYILISTIVSSVIFSSPFGRLYEIIFKPILTCGLSGLGCSDILGVVQNSIFAYLFFLPLFVFIFIPKKQWLVWLIGIIIPFTMVLVGGSKHILWFIIFTIAGGLIGWLINFGIKKFKK